jgi:PadR family transcriptional regulator PadR
MRHPHRDPRVRAARSRWVGERGHWNVRARVERFAEPAVLLLLREGPKHGYELMEHMQGLSGDERGVDAGNLYRILRSLEEDGMVTSQWNAELPGPAKRTYQLTDDGRRLLEHWAEALRRVRAVIDGYLKRFDRSEGG